MVRLISVPEDILLYAFRYALGRRSYAVGLVALEMRMRAKDMWRFRKQIVSEIEYAIMHDLAGDPCDVEEWKIVRKTFTDKDELIYIACPEHGPYDTTDIFPTDLMLDTWKCPICDSLLIWMYGVSPKED